LIAAAPGSLVLAAGVGIGGASAGLVYPPFSDLLARHVSAERRGRALAAVTTRCVRSTGAAVATVIALAPREPLGGGIAARAREGLRCGR